MCVCKETMKLACYCLIIEIIVVVLCIEMLHRLKICNVHQNRSKLEPFENSDN